MNLSWRSAGAAQEGGSCYRADRRKHRLHKACQTILARWGPRLNLDRETPALCLRVDPPPAPGLWACILSVVILFGILLWVFSYKRETANFDPEFSESKRLAHSFHLSFQSMLGASLVTDHSRPSQAVYW